MRDQVLDALLNRRLGFRFFQLAEAARHPARDFVKHRERHFRDLAVFGHVKEERRLLAFAYCHGKTFSTAEYERVGEVDRDIAYREIRALVKNGIVALETSSLR